LTKQDLLGLPAVIGSFNGFYSHSGVFVMYNQTRLLLAIGFVLLAGLVGLALLLRWFWRRRKARRQVAPASLRPI
jgi:nitrate/nitrite transporter NarK